MITYAEYNSENHTFYARLVRATAISGDIVIPGHATDQEIRNFADDNLAAPFEDDQGVNFGDYQDAHVIWETE